MASLSLRTLRSPLRRALLALALPLAAGAAFAQAWPAKPITLIVPFPPGGPTDAMARTLAAEMKDRMGQPMIVENRAGAGGNIGAEYVARAEADGHVLPVSYTHLTLPTKA